MTTEKINETKGKKEDEKQKRRWPYLLVIFLLLLLLLLLLLRSCGNQHPSPNPPPSSSAPSSSAPSQDDTGIAEFGSSSTPAAAENPVPTSKIGSHHHRQGERAGVFFSGAKGSTGTWGVKTPSSNTVIMQCEVVLNGETIAKSATIYPGQRIGGLTLSPPVSSGSYSVTAAAKKKGLLTNYPRPVGDVGTIMNTPMSHSCGQFAMGDIWMTYPKNSWSSSPEVNTYNGHSGTNNFYPTTCNNIAVIHTGHSNGAATPDEQKIWSLFLYFSAF